jgi:hypothetical protein
MQHHVGRLIDHVHHPDGNNIEAVWHGPATRSAPDVVITPAPAA